MTEADTTRIHSNGVKSRKESGINQSGTGCQIYQLHVAVNGRRAGSPWIDKRLPVLDSLPEKGSFVNKTLK